MRVVAKDFDNNGIVDPVCSYFVQGKNYPIYHRNMMIRQMPFLQAKFRHYEDFARATMSDIFGENYMEGAFVGESRTFSTSYFENLGNGTFKIRSLPAEAQFAPVFGLLANDFNGDGDCDILLTGNSYSFNVEDGQFDAFTGLFLQGDGKGRFIPSLSRESSFFVDGDAKGMAELTMADGNSLILAAQNSNKLKVFRTNHSSERMIQVEDGDAYAEILYKNGDIERREFYFGRGYLSSSSRYCKLTNDVVTVTISDFNGAKRAVDLTLASTKNNEKK